MASQISGGPRIPSQKAIVTKKCFPDVMMSKGHILSSTRAGTAVGGARAWRWK